MPEMPKAGDLFAKRDGMVVMTPGASEMSDDTRNRPVKEDEKKKEKTTTTMRKS